MTEVEGSLASTTNFLRENPAYIPILAKIVKVEENPPDVEAKTLGWRWFHIGVLVTKINNLIYANIVKIVYNSRSSTNYRLIDMETAKEALKQVNVKEEQPEEIPSDIFDTIIGYEDVKRMFMEIILKDAQVHPLMVGSPSSGKTLFLLELERLPGSVYGVGSGSTKAGLTEILFDKQPRYLLVDELEKMENPKDLSVLLSLMATGRIVQIKFNRHKEALLNTKVFGACNTTYNIPRELLSRFLVLHFSDYTLEQSRLIAEKVLVKREGFDVNEDLARYVAEAVQTRMRSVDIRDATKIARITTPQGTREDVDRVINTVLKYRQR